MLTVRPDQCPVAGQHPAAVVARGPAHARRRDPGGIPRARRDRRPVRPAHPRHPRGVGVRPLAALRGRRRRARRGRLACDRRAPRAGPSRAARPGRRVDGRRTLAPAGHRPGGSVPHQPGGAPGRPRGIGKGLAVRWAAVELAGAGAGYLVNAGGDGAFGGIGPEGGGWRVGVEDPAGGTEPLLVLELVNTGCATSSVRLRHWLAAGTPVHHLIDPRTGLPGGEGLAAVTVAAQDAAWSEVWSKTLFLAGAAGIRERAERLGLAAAWVGTDGAVGTSAAMDPLVIWRSTHV
ncbi:FAD:protein FMN transferase [Pengzhenrongella phosphoraccumulans]